MKVLVIGDNAACHSMVAKLKESPLVDKIFCIPGNAGIERLAECIEMDITNVQTVVTYARKAVVDYAVICSTPALLCGLADALIDAGIPVFGAKKSSAVIESSRAYTKLLIKKCDIPSPEFKIFNDRASALEYVKNRPMPLVIKGAELSLNNPTVIVTTPSEAQTAITDIMKKQRAGDKLVIVEDLVFGKEFTVYCMANGTNYYALPAVRTYKHLFDDDRGPIVKSMGASLPFEFYSASFHRTCCEKIYTPFLEGLVRDGRSFTGIIGFNMIYTTSGPVLLSCSSCFSNTEIPAVLSLLHSDVLKMLKAVTDNDLKSYEPMWNSDYVCCVTLTNSGNPNAMNESVEISGLDSDDIYMYASVYHCNTAKVEDKIFTRQNQALTVVATSTSAELASSQCYYALQHVKFKNMFLRRDVGKPQK